MIDGGPLIFRVFLGIHPEFRRIFRVIHRAAPGASKGKRPADPDRSDGVEPIRVLDDFSLERGRRARFGPLERDLGNDRANAADLLLADPVFTQETLRPGVLAERPAEEFRIVHVVQGRGELDGQKVGVFGFGERPRKPENAVRVREIVAAEIVFERFPGEVKRKVENFGTHGMK